MSRADIKVGFACNNHCLFCVQGEKRKKQKFKSLLQIKKALEKSAKEGKEEVVFTGGEPTLHPDFLKAVQLAKQLGFCNIQVQSNGRMFAYENFCQLCVKAGVTEFAPALHGPDSKIHDFLTQAPGSFEQTTKGIENLKLLNQRVITNTVVVSTNFKMLPQIAKLLVSLGVDQFQFAFIHLGGRAGENKDWITPKKSEASKYIKKGLDIGIKNKINVMAEAVPYCFMRGYEKYVAENFIPQGSVFDIDFTIADYQQYRKSQGKQKGPNCQRCKYDQICEGPWKEYPEIYGWSEFKPIVKK